MSPDSLLALELQPEQLAGQQPFSADWKEDNAFDHGLAAGITRAASKQTYYIIRTLVDRDRTADAYRAYAYFRWVDDTVDRPQGGQTERLAFVARQQALVASCYRGEWPGKLLPEERLLGDLIAGNRLENGGLRAYIDNMMAVIAFDAERCGRLISQEELDAYTDWLAVAVTEALHTFIGHSGHAPWSESRYLAATAAHITHMLRDTVDDLGAGYYNVPREYLAAHDIGPHDLWSDAYRRWVQSRVQLARTYFTAGKQYLAQVENVRCRLAGLAYVARFEGVLRAIEHEGYRLRAGDSQPKHFLRRIR